MQLKRRPLDILWGPIVLDECQKRSCLSEASSTLLASTIMGHKILSVGDFSCNYTNYET